jgi:hypothetical protein
MKHRRLWITMVGVPLAAACVGIALVPMVLPHGTTKVPADRLHQTLTLAGGVTVIPAPASEPHVVGPPVFNLGPKARTVSGAVVHRTIFYALLTDSEQGSLDALGQVMLRYVDSPVWVVEERNVASPMLCCPDLLGSLTSHHQRMISHKRQSSALWTFYSARTGEYLFAVS